MRMRLVRLIRVRVLRRVGLILSVRRRWVVLLGRRRWCRIRLRSMRVSVVSLIS